MVEVLILAALIVLGWVAVCVGAIVDLLDYLCKAMHRLEQRHNEEEL